MSDTVEKAAAVAPDLQSKAVELIDQLTAGLKAAAPQMADVTLAAIRFQGVMDLIFAIVIFIPAIAAAYGMYRAWRRACSDKASDDIFGPLLFGSVVVLAFNCFAVWLLLQTATWAAIVDPRIALALRVINKLM